MGVITISRLFGCAANEIAAKVAEVLGYEVVDKELLAHVAAEAQASEEEVARYDETALSPVERFLRALVKFATPEEAIAWSPGPLQETPFWLPTKEQWKREGARVLDHEECLKFTQIALKRLAQKGRVIIIGRGGMVVLKNFPKALHVRLFAPLEWRIQRLSQIENIPPGKAKQKIIAEDKRRADYLRHFYGVDWNDPSLYHLVLNVAALGIDAVSQIIISAARELQFEAVGERG
ncbi:MAG: cytidylate kinase-like family protein [Armatimonadetes bacterium]|nr:cytidylate kinase-like family protein [Armatimonadota bacterium]MCX7967521.1 cytidylate kinase-like family protein [Armatimonadota bacterium]MDW8142479.1 cytidylate kinase-like family protein [Armatimonadota bacterium]